MDHQAMAVAAAAPGVAGLAGRSSRSRKHIEPVFAQCAVFQQSRMQLKHCAGGIAYLPHRLLSAMLVRGARFERLARPRHSDIVARCGKHNILRREGLVRTCNDSPVLVKAKQQEWQDLQAEPERGQTPVDRDARQRIAKFKWKEFENAVEYKDLERALKVLETLNNFESDVESDATAEDRNDVFPLSRDDADGALRAESSNGTGTSYAAVSLPRTDYMKILDACQSAQDLELVGQAYEWLQNGGFLQNFGKYKARVFEAGGGRKVVTAEDMLASSGLDASSLSPKKWGLSGISVVQLVAGFAIFSFLVDINIDIRPLAVIIVALGLLDSIYLGGTGQAQLLSLWPGYRRRMLVHEAGHVLVAYMLGCPLRGVVLDAAEALKSGIAGQAGTQFWDESLAREVEQNRISEATLDRYSILLFAGIAAEGLVYGEAEGGESDENLYKNIISGLRPPWGPSKMSNHARWSVLQAFSILKEHRKVHEAIVQELDQGSSLATLVKSIETTMAAQAK